MNPTPATNWPAGQRVMARRKLGFRSSIVLLCAVLALSRDGSLPVSAQEPGEAGQTTDVADAEVLARLSELIQSAASGQLEEWVRPGDPAATNGSPRTADTGSGQTNRVQGTNRSQPDDRRSRGRRSYRPRTEPSRSPGANGENRRTGDRSPAIIASGTNAGPARLDYAAFRIIAERNIFDPNRSPRRPSDPRPQTAPRAVDSLTLVGTMSYERGAFAFFDGSRPEYKKALKLTDLIAGYEVADISPSSVRLAAGTNELELRVGMQLRREESGPWRLASASGTGAAPQPIANSTEVAALPTNVGTNAPAGAAEAESEIIKRLMQRREQE